MSLSKVDISKNYIGNTSSSSCHSIAGLETMKKNFQAHLDILTFSNLIQKVRYCINDKEENGLIDKGKGEIHAIDDKIQKLQAVHSLLSSLPKEVLSHPGFFKIIEKGISCEEIRGKCQEELLEAVQKQSQCIYLLRPSLTDIGRFCIDIAGGKADQVGVVRSVRVSYEAEAEQWKSNGKTYEHLQELICKETGEEQPIILK